MPVKTGENIIIKGDLVSGSQRQQQRILITQEYSGKHFIIFPVHDRFRGFLRKFGNPGIPRLNVQFPVSAETE
jgi:hypothetical protein